MNTMKLAVLDFDSTLYKGETLDDICRHFLTKEDFVKFYNAPKIQEILQMKKHFTVHWSTASKR